MTRSVKICILAFENHRALGLRQKPSIEGSQNFAMGMQLRNPLTTAQVPYVAKPAIAMLHVILMDREGKTR